MPAYRNDHNGDVATVTGVNAKRLDGLDNWHRVKVAAKPAKAEVVEPAESGTPDVVTT